MGVESTCNTLADVMLVTPEQLRKCHHTEAHLWQRMDDEFASKADGLGRKISELCVRS